MPGVSAAALAAALAAPTLAGAHVGALVIDAATGAVVFSQDASGSFQPASTLKLVVGTAALSLLGRDYAFQTQALTDGSIANGVLTGNLYIRGGGDPTLDADALRDAARTLRAQSVTRIDGAVVADASHFTAPPLPPGWVVDDLAQDYAAPVSGLSYDDNAVTISLDAGPAAGTPVTASVMPATPDVILTNDAVTGAATSDDSTVVERVPDDGQGIRLTGSLPAGTKNAELGAAVDSPERFAADALRSALSTAGIATLTTSQGTTPASARAVWTHRSAPMRSLISTMWLPSDNLLAESLLEELGTQSPGGGDSRERGIARESEWLRSLGIDPSTLTIADGSGLSQYDRVTPASLVTLLRAVWSSPNHSDVLRALPVAGTSGTLKDVFRDSVLRGTLIAKTGSMMHVRTLAGYVVQPGRTLIFALLVNDWMERGVSAGRDIRLAQQRFLEAAAATHP